MSEANVKPGRRWFQFSLRTLLILVTLAAGLLVAWRTYVEPYRRQREGDQYRPLLFGHVLQPRNQFLGFPPGAVGQPTESEGAVIGDPKLADCQFPIAGAIQIDKPDRRGTCVELIGLYVGVIDKHLHQLVALRCAQGDKGLPADSVYLAGLDVL